MTNITQNAIWEWFNGHPWVWDILSGFGALVALRILRLAPATSLWARAVRVVLLVACLLAFLSYWNNAFGLLLPFVLMLGVWLWVELTISQSLEAGRLHALHWPFRRETPAARVVRSR